MTRLENMEKCYDAIWELDCADEFKQFIKRMHVFLKNIDKFSLEEIALPNYLWAARRGFGVTTLIKVLSEYLYLAKAIEFCGTEKSFEFKLDYIPPEQPFSELARLDNTIAGYAGYNLFFKGVVCLDIHEWMEHAGEDHFVKLLNYISDNNDKLLVVFCIRTDEKESIEAVESAISSHLRVESLSLQFPEAKEVVELVEKSYIKNNGFFLTDNAKALLVETVEELAASAHFNGFKTVSNLGEDIMFDVLSRDIDDNRKISSGMLSYYRKDSAYVKRALVQSGPRRVIGFLGKEV